MKLSFVLLAAAAATILLSLAPTKAADGTTTPAPAAGDAAKVFAPTDLDALRAASGQIVTVEGVVEAAGESKSKTVRYLNFTKNFHEGCALVFFASKGGEEFSLEHLSTFVGKKIQATGKVGEYNGAVQIAIDKMAQVKEVQ